MPCSISSLFEQRKTKKWWAGILTGHAMALTMVNVYFCNGTANKVHIRLVYLISLAPTTLRRRNLNKAFSLWKRIKCFPSTLRRKNLKTQQSPVILDLRLRKLGQENHTIIATPSFSKSSVFSIISVHTKTKSRRLQICSVWRTFSDNMDGRPNRTNTAVFFKFLLRSVDAASIFKKVTTC